MFCPKATRRKALSEERALPRTPSPKDFPPYRIPPPDMPLSGRKRHAVEPPSFIPPRLSAGAERCLSLVSETPFPAFFAASSLVPLVRKKSLRPKAMPPPPPESFLYAKNHAELNDSIFRGGRSCAFSSSPKHHGVPEQDSLTPLPFSLFFNKKEQLTPAFRPPYKPPKRDSIRAKVFER